MELMSQSIIQRNAPSEFDNTCLKFDYDTKNKYRDKIISTNTIFKLNKCTDKFILKNTGFKSLSSMISFIIIVNKGNIKNMIKTTTSLTWFKENLLYFIVVWGRSCPRWFDVADKFQIGEATSRRIFDVKQQQVLDILVDWPKFTSYAEDINKLQRDDKWVDMFQDTRVIMWDMTDIGTPQPSNAESARLLYSPYYASCCGKGGIALQSSSWIVTHDLWMGAVSDSLYLTKSGILEEQMYFARDDLAYSHIPFTNITDKGFRITAEVFRIGGQRVLQPPFMKSDRRFTSDQTIEAAVIATIRSANERAVNRIKQCGYVKQGLKESENVERVASVFITFGFQCNFMFYPVQ